MQGGHSARISALACSPDGSKIASSSEDGTVKLWSTNGTLLRTLTAQSCPVTALAWSPDGAKIAAGTYYGGYYYGTPGMGLTYLWQAPSGWTAANVSLVSISTNLFGKVTVLAFSANSLQLVSGCEAGSNVVTSVPNGSFVATLPAYNTAVEPAAVTSAAFSAKGMMASGCEDSTVCVYGSSWNLLWTSINAANAHQTNVTAVAFSPDGSLLATASLDQTIKIWSTANWACLLTMSGHTNGVSSVAFSPDGQKIVSGSVDGTVKIWDRASGNCLVTIPAQALPVTATLFSMDSSLVISGGDDGTVRLFSAADGSVAGTLAVRIISSAPWPFPRMGCSAPALAAMRPFRCARRATVRSCRRWSPTRIMSAGWRSRPTARGWPRAGVRWIPPSNLADQQRRAAQHDSRDDERGDGPGVVAGWLDAGCGRRFGRAEHHVLVHQRDFAGVSARDTVGAYQWRDGAGFFAAGQFAGLRRPAAGKHGSGLDEHQRWDLDDRSSGANPSKHGDQ